MPINLFTLHNCSSLELFPFYLQEEDVVTPFGPLHVVAHGDRRLPVILTYHDIGLNSGYYLNSVNWTYHKIMEFSLCS